MAWEHSTGRARTSTVEWQRTRKRILERDGRVCALCGGPGADTVDHIRNVAAGGGDEDANLQAVHDRVYPHCHRAKTGAEGAAARPRMHREPEPHPGLRSI